jgi:hypothetical protein
MKIQYVNPENSFENFRVHDGPDVSQQAFDWHNHVSGICRLVTLRGPAKHSFHHGRLLYGDVRLLSATSGITRRRTDYLNAPADQSWSVLIGKMDLVLKNC